MGRERGRERERCGGSGSGSESERKRNSELDGPSLRSDPRQMSFYSPAFIFCYELLYCFLVPTVVDSAWSDSLPLTHLNPVPDRIRRIANTPPNRSVPMPRYHEQPEHQSMAIPAAICKVTGNPRRPVQTKLCSEWTYMLQPLGGYSYIMGRILVHTPTVDI